MICICIVTMCTTDQTLNQSYWNQNTCCSCTCINVTHSEEYDKAFYDCTLNCFSNGNFNTELERVREKERLRHERQLFSTKYSNFLILTQFLCTMKIFIYQLCSFPIQISEFPFYFGIQGRQTRISIIFNILWHTTMIRGIKVTVRKSGNKTQSTHSK